MDNIRRRADRCAASGVNCCILFGSHFRWDFMPLWERLHDLLRFIATELHERQMVLFDHHSSVLTHRPRDLHEALNIWRRNRHHVPFYPSRESAAKMEFAGSRLNDWRMTDVETGEPAYLPAYNAEQFCMNNPDFQRAYVHYLKRLLPETGIDGLMSDDGIFYGGWRVCACAHCKERFNREYGHRLPPVRDTAFWGNRGSKAFRDWITMRFQSCGDFLAIVKSALPSLFPLLTCCSSSDGFRMPAHGMSYQDFARSCDLVLLEMTGSTPTLAGTWDERIPSQLLHLGIATQHQVPCIGLGYGFFPDTAFFIWALNKFLGSDSWFSTLKGRLGGSQDQIDALPDDSELVGEGYNWEQAHPRLFAGELEADTNLFFSRCTRDYYSQCSEDYVSDYQAGCFALLKANVSYRVVTEIPRPGKVRHLILSSAACLSVDQHKQLAEFMKAGGTVIASGPTGHYDQHADPVPEPWLLQFGIRCELTELARPGSFPPYENLKRPIQIARCSVPKETADRAHEDWFRVPVGKGWLLWNPERISNPGVASAVLREIVHGKGTLLIKGLPPSWRTRIYRDGARLLIHNLPGKVDTLLHAELQNQFIRQRIVEKLDFAPLEGDVVLESSTALDRVLLHSPDLKDSRPGVVRDKTWKLDVSGIRRYFVAECFGPSA